MSVKRHLRWTGLLLVLFLGMGCFETDSADNTPTGTVTVPPAPVLDPTITAAGEAPDSVNRATATSPAVAQLNQTATPPDNGYPPPGATNTPDGGPYPGPTAEPSPPPATATPSQNTSGYPLFMPLIVDEQQPTPTPTHTPTPRPTNTPTPTPIPTLDFAAIEADLAAQGQTIAYNKIGFHIGVGGNRRGIDGWMRRLDEAGVPFFLKTVSDAGPLAEAQAMIRESGVPHTLVFRTSGNAYDTPNYDLPPADAAREHWALHTAAWPPELDKDLVWLETLNEIDKSRAGWLAEFALETAALAERDGFKWAAFGWSSGEPEPSHWELPAMRRFLRLAGENPDRLAISLHEYSYLTDEIGHQYPYKVGRFQQLFEICDRYGIPRPTVLITEWGWQYEDNPPVDKAMADIMWAARLYAAYPQVKGAAIWYLGPGFGNIADQTQALITPVMAYSLTTYFPGPPPGRVPIVEPAAFAP